MPECFVEQSSLEGREWRVWEERALVEQLYGSWVVRVTSRVEGELPGGSILQPSSPVGEAPGYGVRWPERKDQRH